MKLKEILKGAEGKIVQGSLDVEIKSMTIDSRKAGKDSLFIAMVGMTVDGHKFIPSAYEKGCRAVITEHSVESIPEDMTVYQVEDARDALDIVAANFYAHPAEGLNMIGVTGTNGKTSTTYFIESVLNHIQHKTAVIGTVEIRIGGKKREIDFATSTTPDTIELNQMLRIMADEKCDDVVMEVSSHSLELKKVKGINFKVGIFTNLTQDHLDFHKTMENYCKAKAKLFKMCQYGIINVDDEWAGRIIENAECSIITYSIEKESDLKARDIEYLPDRVHFTVNIKGEAHRFELPVPGRFSVYNALAAIGAMVAMGVEPEKIKEGINNIKGVPGRIQSIKNNKGFNVIVDYAHTPDGLENIINAVREFTKGRVLTVFGCGGDRDKTKRPIMGEIVARLSDVAIVTSDNPRSEDPQEILKEIEVGVKKVTDSYEMCVDRRDAIKRAIEMAEKGDSVIIAGKGHENYQILKDKTIHFDDAETAKEILGE
ncbi:MAG: UDP-N-acetylmuramoyl-L-alanyl-D-glutamate--2,6-diaminopimelate ligase [Clostridia bacterium]|nr:UDP-N-acetylmuramoyl-L-alanyl-D-glutamate--2,6-diaminopimelate ligase [Clostridia bacterium]